MKDLNMKVKIMKLMEDNIGEYLCGLELDKNFLKPQKYIPYGKKDEQILLYKNKNLYSIRDAMNKVNRRQIEKKIFAIF